MSLRIYTLMLLQTGPCHQGYARAFLGVRESPPTAAPLFQALYPRI